MKTCKECRQQFEILEKDKEFYAIFEVPEPTICRLCRTQRRLGYRNERFLYHRKCDLTGKQIISSFSKEKPFPVYDNDAWWSDKWDAKEYAQEYDFNRSFFDQWFELRDKVPRLARQQQKPMENSDYCNCASRNKNCYLVFSTNHCEDCYYGSWVNYSKDCLDCGYIMSCELCYDCVGCVDCYDLRYSFDCTNCKDSQFLRNCHGCQYCFGCTNQINKTYMVFNEQKTQEEYEAFMQQVDTGKYSTIKSMKEKWEDYVNDLVVKEFHGRNNINCVGDYIENSKNCYMCFDVNDCEDCRYITRIQKAKTCMDYNQWGENAERIYECHACGYDVFNLRFCNLCWQGCSDLTYCDQCTSSKNCFGCVGLRNAKFCIFNKQYTEEEYYPMVEKIIEHMKRTGEWGEFFPLDRSCYAYDETLSWELIRLAEDEIKAKGWLYQNTDKQGAYTGPKYEIPDNIDDVNSEIAEKILISQESGKPYKVIPQEYKFLKQQRIPIPRKTPDERHYERIEKRNPIKLWPRACSKCSASITTSYAPDRPEKVYCEECYLKEVY